MNELNEWLLRLESSLGKDHKIVQNAVAFVEDYIAFLELGVPWFNFNLGTKILKFKLDHSKRTYAYDPIAKRWWLTLKPNVKYYTCDLLTLIDKLLSNMQQNHVLCNS